jgi:hypothetical protein
MEKTLRDGRKVKVLGAKKQLVAVNGVGTTLLSDKRSRLTITAVAVRALSA